MSTMLLMGRTPAGLRCRFVPSSCGDGPTGDITQRRRRTRTELWVLDDDVDVGLLDGLQRRDRRWQPCAAASCSTRSGLDALAPRAWHGGSRKAVRGRDFAGHAHHRHAVGTVGGHLEVEHRIGALHLGGQSCPDGLDAFHGEAADRHRPGDVLRRRRHRDKVPEP